MMDEALVQKLLPCPFCGGVNIERHPDDHVMMRCTDCEARGPIVSFGEPKSPEQNWNTRALQSRPADALEEVEQAAKVIYAKFEGCDLARAEEVWRQAVEGDDDIRAARQLEIEEMRDIARAVLALPQASTRTDALDERGRIVKWLRAQKGHPGAVEPAREATVFYASIFADRIESADHITSNAREG